ncbi:MAG: chromosomal replication initiator protein DnaA [Planctomycetes bacterium]|nr:chromosomal replication initiator protein DnaA [Planctomycetota bacterium]
MSVSTPSPELSALWEQVLAELESALGSSKTDSWLRPARLTRLCGRRATIGAPSALHRARIERELHASLLRALDVDEIAVDLLPDSDIPLGRHDLPLAPPAPAKATPPVPAQVSPSDFMDGADRARPILNPGNHFDSFVVGPCNRFAHAACRGVADRPATSFNPLFLHGSVGLGKTHLMQAICHHLLDRNSELQIVYLSCEEFINHFISALQQGDIDAFRTRYRNADVLIVDDVQMLANKARTQEEFFHTFNALHNARKQIVLSSDAPPHEIPALQERLVSRFKWGLVAEIEPPCFETRVAILRSKALEEGLALRDDVAQFIAEHVENNVRELEGCLTRLQAMAALTNRAIDVPLARQAMGSELQQKSRPIRMDDILGIVTAQFMVKVADLQSKRRAQSIVQPRQVAMYHARKLTEMSLEEIGGYFGGRDHSTVLYSVEKVDRRRRVDHEFSALLTDLERRIRRTAQQGD